MNTPVDEVRRLRGLLDQKERELTELRSLVAAHLEATTEDPEMAVRREHEAFERGYQHGDEMGWRRGVEHALAEVDRAHWSDDAHDHRGQMRELGMHSGPVPPPMTAEQIVTKAEQDNKLHAEWWWKQWHRTHPEEQRQPARVRQLRPKEPGAEKEAV